LRELNHKKIKEFGVNRFAQGLIATIVGASLWGLSGAFAQYLYQHYEISALFVTLVRTSLAGAIFLVFLLFARREKLAALMHDASSVKQLLIFGCVGLFAAQFTFVELVGYTNAGTATVLQSSSVVFVMLATCIMGRRAPHVRELLGLICAFAAAVLIATKGDLSVIQLPPEGVMWGIANSLSVAFYIMYPRRLLDRWGSVAICGTGLFICGISTFVVWLLAGALFGLSAGALGAPAVIPQMGLDGIGCLLGIALVGTLGAFALYLHGISIVGGLTGSLLGTMEPVCANILAVFWLNTTFTRADWLGLVLMIATTVLVSLGGKESSATAAA
jgi:drug/metabolite transporter (DMT)-like permease